MAMSSQDRFVEIGRIGRPRGLDGIVRFMPNELFNADIFESLDLFYVRNNRSDLIPIRIEEVQTEIKKKQQSFFVKFDMITNRSEAEESMNRAVFVETALISSLQSTVQDEESLTGYTVLSDDQEFGVVLDIMESPAHPILEVKVMNGSVLIPMVDEYIDQIDHHDRVIHGKNLELFSED